MTEHVDLDHVQSAYHYRLMRRAIDRLDAAEGAVSLPAIAAEMRMSPAHFQRLFSRWAGVSPARYQQWLALDHGRRLLRERFTTLETAGALGLSGGGRLHDLFLRWEAMTPGEYAEHGAGLTIRRGWFATPFGRALAMATERGLCGLAFAEETGDAAAFADLHRRWPGATHVEAPEAIAPWIEAAFAPSRPRPTDPGETTAPSGGETPLHLIGAPFQIKVWEALLHIPSGHVTTYSEIARAIGRPRAVRAVATAVGRNPVSWLIPCHRALRKSGALGGYHWGLPVKRAMLAWETADIG